MLTTVDNTSDVELVFPALAASQDVYAMFNDQHVGRARQFGLKALIFDHRALGSIDVDSINRIAASHTVQDTCTTISDQCIGTVLKKFGQTKAVYVYCFLVFRSINDDYVNHIAFVFPILATSRYTNTTLISHHCNSFRLDRVTCSRRYCGPC